MKSIVKEEKNEYTITEAAKELEISRWTLRNYIKDGTIPSRLTKKGKMSIRIISKDALDKYRNRDNDKEEEISQEKPCQNEASQLRMLEATQVNNLGKEGYKTLINLAKQAGKVDLLERELEQTKAELK